MLSTESDARKDTPIYSGVLKYFPDAIAAVARLSKKANDKHNPGEPMHWSRDKSDDHGDCLLRHQIEPENLDAEFGELHAASVAWRALAQLQLLEEQRRLDVLNGPMGRVEAAPEPEPGTEWERGTGERPAWAAPTTLVDMKMADDCDEEAATGPAHDCRWMGHYFYRKHQG